jgi:hypothetical protein
MNTTRLEKLEEELASHEHEAQTIGIALMAINALECMSDDLLDTLAQSVTMEQVARASSERDCG